ncbi:MAG: acyltransferase [Bacilli bacterium]|nr:acyltransferase [Bacilli bacterium]
MITRKRDCDLDKLRGLAMVYIMFIHTIFGTGIFNGNIIRIVKSYFLIEMPVFFFIAGASNYYSKCNSKMEFILKRFKRLLIPYYFYAFIIIIINSIMPKVLNFSYKFSFITWLMPITNLQQSFSVYFTGALWFIPIYLFVMIFFPYLKDYYVKKDKEKSLDIYLPLLYMFLAILLIDLKSMFYINIFIKKICFYSFFTYLGLFWNKISNSKNRKKINKILFFVLIISLVGYIFLMFTNYFYIDMQINKQGNQGANLAFMVYGIMGISFIGIIYRYIIKIVDFVCRIKIFNWVFKQYKTNTYTIYLFHMIALYIVDLIVKSGVISLSNDYVTFIFRIVILIPLSALFGFLFGFIEHIEFKFIKNIFSKYILK